MTPRILYKAERRAKAEARGEETEVEELGGAPQAAPIPV
jgi:hypothetical protein